MKDCMKKTNLIVTAACLLGGSLALAEPQTAVQPNILFIITDQQYAGMSSCAGNPYVKTSALDSLAATGARFELAYSTHQLCVPSRTSMLTGIMPSRIGLETVINPSEMRNLALEPEFAPVLAEHRQRMKEWSQQNGETLDSKYMVQGKVEGGNK